MKGENPKFASYWHLSRKDKSSGVLEFTAKDGKTYQIVIEIVQ